jgi:catechol 2,3-dioxygenase-like lactoylglutathione lyase family enzyme
METETVKTVQALKAHLALNVRDAVKSTEFYKKMLGLEPSKVRKGYAKFDVANPPLNLTLNEVPFNDRGALSHLGIQVASTGDVLAMREKWGEAGLITRDEMQTNCCYALQDKTWVHDPDGNEWEVFVVLEDNLAETTSCCATDAGLANVAESCATAAPSASSTSSCCGSAAAPTSLSR